MDIIAKLDRLNDDLLDPGCPDEVVLFEREALGIASARRALSLASRHV